MKIQDPIISVDDVTFSYAGVPVVEHLSFSVQQGDYIGVIGPNGGGKTTLIKLLLGLLKPDTGSISILGEPVALRTKRHLIGYVPQRIAHSSIEFPATVQEIVESGRTTNAGLWKPFTAQDKKAVKSAIRHASIQHLAKRRLSDLSGGERQRAFIARALASEPRILILDEPTVGVDVKTQEKFFEFLAELNKKHGITILFVTHDIDVIAQEASTVLCLNRALVCYGSPQDFIKTEYMEQLYGKTRKFVVHHH